MPLPFLGKLKNLTEEILSHCLGSDLSLYTLTGSSYIQRDLSATHQPVQKVCLKQEQMLSLLLKSFSVLHKY